MEKYKNFNFLKNYQRNKNYRDAFNKLISSIFPIHFEEWYQSGYWNDKYIPYTLFDGENAVANVSVNIINCNVMGVLKRFIQIGTVATDVNYRNQGLSKFLMGKVLEEWRDKCEFIYLYANKTVLDMYPKYGFTKVKEYEYFKSVKAKLSNNHFGKFDMYIQSNKDKLYDYAKSSAVFGKISLQENADLIMLYCATFLKDNVYYNKFHDVIVVATIQDKQITLWDVFSKTKIPLNEIINSLVDSLTADKITLGFTPENCEGYDAQEILGDDTLFFQSDKTKFFEGKKLMFPLLSHA